MAASISVSALTLLAVLVSRDGVYGRIDPSPIVRSSYGTEKALPALEAGSHPDRVRARQAQCPSGYGVCPDNLNICCPLDGLCYLGLGSETFYFLIDARAYLIVISLCPERSPMLLW